MIFSLREILDRAKKKKLKQKLAVAAAEDIYILRALARLHQSGLVEPILIGNKNLINELAKQENIPISKYSIIDTKSTQESASKAVELIRDGHADLLMKGMLSTKTLLVEVLNKDTGIAAQNLLNHMALFESPYYHKVFAVTDAAMNVAPDKIEKVAIIQNTVNAFIKIGVKLPKVALLTAVEKVNPKMLDTVEAAAIVEQHYESRIADCIIEGPMALDLAVSKVAAEHKHFIGNVPGDADILVVPEITSGNILYKSLTCLGGAKTAGVVIGAKVPIILTSRADSDESKLYSIALAIELSQ
jgi:phosphate butyryltransferase